jgi:hypothetical protein
MKYRIEMTDGDIKRTADAESVEILAFNIEVTETNNKELKEIEKILKTYEFANYSGGKLKMIVEVDND